MVLLKEALESVELRSLVQDMEKSFLFESVGFGQFLLVKNALLLVYLSLADSSFLYKIFSDGSVNLIRDSSFT